MSARLDELARAIVAQARAVRTAQKAYYAHPSSAPQKLSLLDASRAAERQLDKLLDQHDREQSQPSLF